MAASAIPPRLRPALARRKAVVDERLFASALKRMAGRLETPARVPGRSRRACLDIRCVVTRAGAEAQRQSERVPGLGQEARRALASRTLQPLSAEAVLPAVATPAGPADPRQAVGPAQIVVARTPGSTLMRSRHSIAAGLHPGLATMMAFSARAHRRSQAPGAAQLKAPRRQ
jgi:hypothetical protein